MPIFPSTFTSPLHVPPPILPFVYIHCFVHLSWWIHHLPHHTNLIFSNFIGFFKIYYYSIIQIFSFFSDWSDERAALNECTRLLQELNSHKYCQIYSPPKSIYHQNPVRQDKSYIDQPYSVTKLLTVSLQDPDIVEIEYNTKGKHSGIKIEKKFDVAIGFPNRTGYYPYPMCSVIKFELNPANQKKFYSEGKPTVLMRYTLSQDYTLQNGPGKVFHKFTNSSLPNHADCFFNRQNTALNGNRTNPIFVYQYCNLPHCTCQAQQPAPPNQPSTNPISSQGGDGGQTQSKGGAQGGDGG